VRPVPAPVQTGVGHGHASGHNSGHDRAELECKLQPALTSGGCVFSLDHRIPNGTPIENYRYYVDLGREMLGLPPLGKERRGWQRMAF